MNTKRLFASLCLTGALAFAGFGAVAAEEPHDCATHCAMHTDKDAKMCTDHCKSGVAWDHACATHCAAQASDDKNNMCATHCANPN